GVEVHAGQLHTGVGDRGHERVFLVLAGDRGCERPPELHAVESGRFGCGGALQQRQIGEQDGAVHRVAGVGHVSLLGSFAGLIPYPEIYFLRIESLDDGGSAVNHRSLACGPPLFLVVRTPVSCPRPRHARVGAAPHHCHATPSAHHHCHAVGTCQHCHATPSEPDAPSPSSTAPPSPPPRPP